MVLLFSCDFPSRESIIEETKDAIWAIPVLRDEIKIQDIFVDDNEGVSVFADTEGKVIVTYEGEVLRDPAQVVFPPIPGIMPIPLLDTVFVLDLTMGGGTLNEIDSAVFLRDFLHFRIKSTSETPFLVRGWIDEINKDGVRLEQVVAFPGSPTGAELEFVGEEIKLEGWNLIGNDNKITFHYEAIPVGADFQQMSIETIDGEELELESIIIDEGIVFAYPDLGELDVVKNTNFDFTKDNSNIAIIFNNRVGKFNYTIDAVANPLNEPDLIGFMTNNSYYAVQVKVEVPMHLAIKNLKLSDTLDLSFETENEYIDTAELKIILENNFPIDVSTQLYILDENNQVVDSLFEGGEIFLKGGTYLPGGMLEDVESQTYFVPFTEDKINKLLKSKRLLVEPTFISTPNGEEHIWIYENYKLDIKMGAKFSLK